MKFKTFLGVDIDVSRKAWLRQNRGVTWALLLDLFTVKPGVCGLSKDYNISSSIH